MARLPMMFVRICPYSPFSARICLNHESTASVVITIAMTIGAIVTVTMGATIEAEPAVT
jgi:hypothetical protein